MAARIDFAKLRDRPALDGLGSFPLVVCCVSSAWFQQSLAQPGGQAAKTFRVDCSRSRTIRSTKSHEAGVFFVFVRVNSWIALDPKELRLGARTSSLIGSLIKTSQTPMATAVACENA